jgi:hypothetical protein
VSLWSYLSEVLTGLVRVAASQAQPTRLNPATALNAPPTGQIWKSYYYAGSTRIAMRVEGDLTEVNNGVFYFAADHLGSTSVTLDSDGNKIGELRYTPFGETRTG